MLDKELCAWLALHQTPHLSGAALRRLIKHTSDPEDIFRLSESTLTALKIDPRAQRSLSLETDYQRIDKSVALIKSLNISVLPICHEDYPLLLKQISDPPPLLYVRGNIALLNQPQLAMVGSRRSSKQGKENAFRFAAEFARNGFTVNSGLALGVDAQCHRGALAAEGNTVAVLGTGVDVVYPAANRMLFDQMVECGAVVSEFPLGTQPRPSLFPKRNRVISGMSLGVLVVEAALKSGSLITARCALEQGREVFAIPSSIHNPAGHGCHALIKQGAKLVETTADVLEEFEGWLLSSHSNNEMTAEDITEDKVEVPVKDIVGPEVITAKNTKNDQTIAFNTPNLSPEEKKIIDLLGFDPATMDLLQQRSGCSLAELASVLTTLELKGLIENTAGSYQRLN
jgi:DNA processing protein